MKKSIISLTLMAILPLGRDILAQDTLANLKNKITPYGFFRTAAVFDSRESKAGSEDLFYFVPMDLSYNLEGQEIYSNPSFKSYAITTRLGLDVSGYQYGSMKVNGKIETDFYLMNGSTASLRLRHAYVNVFWDAIGYMENKLSIKAGQSWHPMAADQPYCVNVETGAPFTPFNWSPQLMFDFTINGGVTLSAGALYPMQFLPTGPQGESEKYVKYGLIPELYAGISYADKYFQVKAGADFISLRPRIRTLDHNYSEELPYDEGSRVKDRINMISPFVYFQYSEGPFKFNAKSVFAQGGDHLRLMGGYALYDWRDPFQYMYTQLRSSVSFISFSVGNKVQFMCMGGYMRSLGTQHNLPVDSNDHCLPSSIYYSSFGSKNIAQMFRATPTLAYNAGKLTVALEYNNTSVQYGDINKLDGFARPLEDLHWVMNHRVMAVLRFSL